jgi:hypothetical protein
MLLTREYRTIRASQYGDYSGWITPENKFLKYIGSHRETLRAHGYQEADPDSLISEGFVWLNKERGVLYCDMHYSRVNDVKRVLEEILDDSVHEVEFSLLNDKNKRTGRSITLYFKNGYLE